MAKKINSNMTEATLIIILISTMTINIFGQQCDSCKKEFDELFASANKMQ